MTRSGSHAFELHRLRCDFARGKNKIFSIAHCRQATIDTADDHFCRRSVIKSHHWQAAGHGFGGDIAKCLGETGHQKQVG